MFKNINESKVAADAAKRFRMLCEYTFNITEDDGEEDMDMAEPIGGDMQQGSEDMQQQNADMNAEPQGEEQLQQMPDMMGDEVPENGEQGAPGFNPQPQDDTVTNGDVTDDGIDELGSDDEVIDVDDLTQSQEETEEKVDDIQVSMERGFEKLLGVVSKLDKMIDASTANMEQIKQEIEKRNPTPLEKLNMRAANDSYPFNVSPDDYWKEKEATSNYRIGGEGEKDAPQYTITQGDIDKITDFKTISKELDDSMMNQNLLNIFGLR